MAINKYNAQNTFTIDEFTVEDFIIKYNTVSYITLEVIFNSDITQIINKYPVIVSLVNISSPSVVYASFTLSTGNIHLSKTTIPVNGTLTSYTKSIAYFSTRNISKNFFNSSNSSVISNTPNMGDSMQLKVSINGISKLYGTKNFSVLNTNNTPNISTTFNYLQNYSLKLSGYYFENTDTVVIKMGDNDSSYLSVGSINNFDTSITPLRQSNIDFVYTGISTASFSGTNSYLVTDIFNIINAPVSTLWIRKNSNDLSINNPNQNNFLKNLVVGSTHHFGIVLKNQTSVSDTIKIEIPALNQLNDLSISSITVSGSTKVVFSNTPVITSLGNGKFIINLSYLPTNESNGTVASYISTITINFSSIAGNISINNNFTYINSTA